MESLTLARSSAWGAFSSIVVIVALMLASVPAALSAGEVLFTGFYDVEDPSSQDDDVCLTLTLVVRNPGNDAVSDVVITLEDPLGLDDSYGTLATESISPGEIVTLSSEFLVPRREYDTWQEEGRPFLRIAYQDADGQDREDVLMLDLRIWEEE